MDLHVHTSALELDVVVAGQRVSKGTQPRCRLLAGHRLLLLDLQDLHQSSFCLVVSESSCPIEMRSSSRVPSRSPSGKAAEGEAPGCDRDTRTLSTPGRMAKCRGEVRVAASPSIPAGTGCLERTSKCFADHSRHGRCRKRAAPRLTGSEATVMPSRPSSMWGRVPEPTALPSR